MWSPDSLHLKSVGSTDAARRVMGRFYRGSRAYRELFNSQGVAANESEVQRLAWENVPVLTKNEFYSKHSWRDLVPDEARRDIYSVIRSSGSSTGSNGARHLLVSQLRQFNIGQRALRFMPKQCAV